MLNAIQRFHRVGKFFLLGISFFLTGLALVAVGQTRSGGLQLGPLQQLSAPGEPLRAEVEMIEGKVGELDNSIELSVGTPAEYQNFGLEYKPIVATLTFSAYRRADNRLFLRINSNAPGPQGNFDLLMQVRWAGGVIRKQYQIKGSTDVQVAAAASPSSALIASGASLSKGTKADRGTNFKTLEPLAQSDKATTPARGEKKTTGGEFKTLDDKNGAVSTERKTVKQSTDKASNSLKKSSTPNQVPQKENKTTGTSETKDAYKVKQGQTLHSIAMQTKPKGVSLEQMSVAIFYANRDAFIRENLNLIKARKTIKLPSAEDAAKVKVDEAKTILLTHRGNFNAYRQTLGEKAVAATTSDKANESTGKIGTQGAEAQAPKSADQLTLSSGSKGSKADELAQAKQKTLNEQRQAELERNKKELEALKPLPSGSTTTPSSNGNASSTGVGISAETVAPNPQHKTEFSMNSLWSWLQQYYGVVTSLVVLLLVLLLVVVFRRRGLASEKQEEDLLMEHLEDASQAHQVSDAHDSAEESNKDSELSNAEESKTIIQADVDEVLEGSEKNDASTSTEVQKLASEEVTSVVAKPPQPAVGSVLEVAQRYIAQGRLLTAESMLTATLPKGAQERMPYLMLLAQIYSQLHQNAAFNKVLDEVKTITNGQGPQWEAMSMIAPKPTPTPQSVPTLNTDAAAMHGAEPVAFDLSSLSLDLDSDDGLGLHADPTTPAALKK